MSQHKVNYLLDEMCVCVRLIKNLPLISSLSSSDLNLASTFIFHYPPSTYIITSKGSFFSFVSFSLCVD